MNIRKTAFELLKKNEHQIITDKYNEIKVNIHDPSPINNEKLNEFIKFAIENSSYYQNLKVNKISEFPVLTKEILKLNMENIITVDKNKLQDYPFMTTSGSYGTPFKFYVNQNKRYSQQAEVLYFGLLSNFDIGTKHIYCRAINPNLKNQLIKNQYVLKPEKIDKEWIIKAIKYIQKVKPEVIISYPTVLNNIALFMKKYKTPIRGVEGIITIGEGMTEEARKNITDSFGVEPYSRYSTEELGVLGNNYGSGSHMLINQVNYLIEVLDDNNTPVKEGEVGKVVVTDFNSHITPLIRYDTGDLARVKSYKDGLVYEIDNLEGRKIETIYTTKGTPLTPFVINSLLRTYEDVVQFQFIQYSHDEYEMKILPIDVNNHVSYEGVYEELKNILGKDSRIKLNIVSEIETLRSGKRPYIINLYRKEQ